MAQESTRGEQRGMADVVHRNSNLRSVVWNDFDRFQTADGKEKARCKRCHAELGASGKHGTSHLLRHLKSSCTDKEPKRRRSISRTTVPLPQPCAAAEGESPNRGSDFQQALLHLAGVIAFNGRDSSIVEDGHFRSFVNLLNPGFEMPSRLDIKGSRDAASDEARKDFIALMGRPTVRVNVSIGTTKTVDGQAVYMACRFIDDHWNLRTMIADAYMVVPHSDYHGPLLGVTDADIKSADDQELILDLIAMEIDDIGISSKIFSITWGIIHHLQGEHQLEKIFSGTRRSRREQFYNTLHTIFPEELILTTYMDDVLHSIARCFSADLEFFYTSFGIFEPLSPILRRQKRAELLSQLGLIGVLTYNEHWYSCYCSLEILHDQSSAAKAEGTAATEEEEPLIETEFEETEFTELLRKIWGTIYRAIRTISVHKVPTSNLCLRELFKVRKVLQHELARASRDNAEINEFDNHGFLHGNVSDVLGKAKDILDKSIQDSYLVWSIPLALDPRYKLVSVKSEFDTAFGSEAGADMISMVSEKIQEIFGYYINDGQIEIIDGESNFVNEIAVDNFVPVQQISSEENEAEQPNANLHSNFVNDMAIDNIASVEHMLMHGSVSEQHVDQEGLQEYEEGLEILIRNPEETESEQQADEETVQNSPQQRDDEEGLQQGMAELAIVREKSELDRYLEEECVTELNDFDVLNWWKETSKRSKYPTLARMARDALAVPICNELSPELVALVRSRIRDYNN